MFPRHAFHRTGQRTGNYTQSMQQRLRACSSNSTYIHSLLFPPRVRLAQTNPLRETKSTKIIWWWLGWAFHPFAAERRESKT